MQISSTSVAKQQSESPTVLHHARPSDGLALGLQSNVDRYMQSPAYVTARIDSGHAKSILVACEWSLDDSTHTCAKRARIQPLGPFATTYLRSLCQSDTQQAVAPAPSSISNMLQFDLVQLMAWAAFWIVPCCAACKPFLLNFSEPQGFFCIDFEVYVQ